MVLKLFDRRFATQLRRDEHAAPWTLDSEIQYRKFIENGGAKELITNMEEAEDVINDRRSTVENETYLHYSMQNLYKTEPNAYCVLKQLQGKRIPQLICTLEVPVISGLAPQSIQEHTTIPGFLLQHIDGVHLSDLSVYVPQSHWQSVCDQALDTINKITGEGVLKMDVKPRNFMVCKDPKDRFKVFMFDFGLCHFHWDCNNDDHFWEWKAAEDEEGSLGRAMEKILKEGFVYRRSDRQEELDRKYMMK